MSINEKRVVETLEACGFVIADRAEIPGRAASLRPIPADLSPPLRDWLINRHPQGLYAHQADAIEKLLEGKHVCLSTPTASGKSLVFMAAAVDRVLKHPLSKVLALYPARALIQDQIDKWQTILAPFDISLGFIDGSVATANRNAVLQGSSVVLMTPDVAHAWLLSHLQETAVLTFLKQARLLILDEAHVYDGAFGTNMAYFLRRLVAASSLNQLICATATLGEPVNFVELLTGFQTEIFGGQEDGSPAPPKTVLLADPTGRSFDSTIEFLLACSAGEFGSFLAFGESRKAVEQVVAACHRAGAAPAAEDEKSQTTAEAELPEDEVTPCSADEDAASPIAERILPYRAGYETQDREAIQKGLSTGELVGVVSTSALELGLDIGDIDLLILLSPPASRKAMWQRLGRAGRKNPAVCVLIDPQGSLRDVDLDEVLRRPLEPNWLYLENRYIQYAQSLCAAQERTALAQPAQVPPFASLPASFTKMLENEINPTEIVPADLYPLKQRAQDGPHYEFPLRSGVERQFEVVGRYDRPLGKLNFEQALREAYPGAVYYYMARPYRVRTFDYRKGRIEVSPERQYTTQPIAQTTVFPRLADGILALWTSPHGLLAEVELQVSERVLGFWERRGSAKEEHRYGPHSIHSQREINRFFQSTGVCWSFENWEGGDSATRYLLQSYCRQFGVQEHDVGVGWFFAKQSPIAPHQLRGPCIFDSVYGSLRLTQRLAEHFPEMVAQAEELANGEGDTAAAAQLQSLLAAARSLTLQPAVPSLSWPVGLTEDGGDWAVLVASGQIAMLANGDGSKEVEVVGYRYTPRGLMYELRHLDSTVTWTAPANGVVPIHGRTRLVRTNLVTGDEEPLG